MGSVVVSKCVNHRRTCFSSPQEIKFRIVLCYEIEPHYSDVIMGAIASQITSIMIVYSPAYSGTDQSKHQNSASLAIVRGIHQWPAHMASNAENVSIWWRHYGSIAPISPRITWLKPVICFPHCQLTYSERIGHLCLVNVTNNVYCDNNIS